MSTELKTSSILLRERQAGPAPQGPPPAARAEPIARLAVVSGLALALIGWTDVLLLWYPLDLGNPEWEFATTSGMFDALPLGTIGLLLLTFGAMARGARRLLITLAVGFVLITLGLLTAYALYAMSTAVAWRAVEPGVRWVLVRAMVKTSVLAITYSALYSWLGWTSWRASNLPWGRSS